MPLIVDSTPGVYDLNWFIIAAIQLVTISALLIETGEGNGYIFVDGQIPKSQSDDAYCPFDFGSSKGTTFRHSLINRC